MMGESKRFMVTNLIAWGAMIGMFILLLFVLSNQGERPTDAENFVYMIALIVPVAVSVWIAWERGRNPFIWGFVALLSMATIKFAVLGIPLLKYTEKRREELRFDDVFDLEPEQPAP